jgi:hypothetical protein
VPLNRETCVRVISTAADVGCVVFSGPLEEGEWRLSISYRGTLGPDRPVLCAIRLMAGVYIGHLDNCGSHTRCARPECKAIVHDV